MPDLRGHTPRVDLSFIHAPRPEAGSIPARLPHTLFCARAPPPCVLRLCPPFSSSSLAFTYFLMADPSKLRSGKRVRARSPSTTDEQPRMAATSSATGAVKRGRKRNDDLPPNRARDVQRAFRARRAAHLQVSPRHPLCAAGIRRLMQNCRRSSSASTTSKTRTTVRAAAPVRSLRSLMACAGLRAALGMPPAERPALGKGPTGKDRPKQEGDADAVPAHTPTTPGPTPTSAHQGSSSPSSASSHSPASLALRPLSPQTPLHTPLDSAGPSAPDVWGELGPTAAVDDPDAKPPPTPFAYSYDQAGPARAPPPYGASPVSATSALGSYAHALPSPPGYLGSAHVTRAPTPQMFAYASAPASHRHSLPSSLYGAVSPYADARQQPTYDAYTAAGYIDPSHAYAITPPGSAHGHMEHAAHMANPHRRSYTEPYLYAHTTPRGSGDSTPLGSYAHIQPPEVPPMSAPAYLGADGSEHMRPSPRMHSMR
jgi:hypothetical protein